MATDREIVERALSFAPPKSVEELREMVIRNSRAINAQPPEIGAFEEDIELRPGLRADIAVPKGPGPHPVVIYFHGGGWVAGNTKSHRKLPMQLAAEGFLCVNVDYRLAPEHPFPAGLDDCLFAARWSVANVGRWKGDSTRMAMGGDSAGANIAAASLVALSADATAPTFKAALLFYGLYDMPRVSETRRYDMILKNYLGAQYPSALADPRVSPILAIKPGAMPPTFLIVGTKDDLEPETIAMAQALQRARIAREVHVLEGMPHAFLQIWMLAGCAEGLRLSVNFLRRHLAAEEQ